VRIAWTADLHLNFVSDAGIDQFIEQVRTARPDAVLALLPSMVVAI